MKKTVLAVAALSLATGAAFAQSSLQLYGLVDLSVENVKVDGKSGITRVSTSNLATSRLGFKGTEDLGGGLKANFVLESAVGADVGSGGSAAPTSGGSDVGARFFDRSAWVGISGGFGAIRIGRMDSLLGATTGNSSVMGNQAYDDFKIAKMVGADEWRRIDNAISYALPEIIPGLKAEVQYSLAAGADGYASPNNSLSGTQAEAANDDTDKQYGLSASYTSGPLTVGASMLRAKLDQTGSVEEGGTLGYAAYDFGSFKLIGYHQADKQTGTEKRKLTGIRVNVPVTSDLLITASYASVKNTTYGGAGDNDDAKILALKAIYSLSKRTAVYALVTDVSNDPVSSLLAGASVTGTYVGAAGKDSRGIAFGVRHSF